MSSQSASPIRRLDPAREHATKTRLLDAAERLFAERGFAGTSLRAVTQAAGTAVSAANYHFGSKEALLRATLLRRVEPVNRGRLARLDALEAGPAAPSVEQILEAFLRPAFELRASSAEGAAQIRQVAARLYADPPEIVASLAHDLFQPIHDRFVDALSRALPGRERSDVALAYLFTVGVLVHCIAGHLQTPPGLAGLAAERTDEEVLRRLVAFAAAGLRSSGRDGATNAGADGSKPDGFRAPGEEPR